MALQEEIRKSPYGRRLGYNLAPQGQVPIQLDKAIHRAARKEISREVPGLNLSSDSLERDKQPDLLNEREEGA